MLQKGCWSLSSQYLHHFGSKNGFLSLRVPTTSTNTGSKLATNHESVSPTKANANKGYQKSSSKDSERLASISSSSEAQLITLLVDRNISPPIRVISHSTPFTEDYIKDALLSAHKFRYTFTCYYCNIHVSSSSSLLLMLTCYAGKSTLGLILVITLPIGLFMVSTLIPAHHVALLFNVELYLYNQQPPLIETLSLMHV